MLIGIDGNEANCKGRVGVHQYAFEILWAFYRLNEQAGGKHQFRVYLSGSPGKDLPRENPSWHYKVLTGKGIWILTRLMPHLLSADHPDVFFTPSHYAPPISRSPKVITVHDLKYLEFSEQFRKKDFWQLKYWSAISIYISKCIISVSRATKKDIVRHYPFASKKVTVVHHGYDKKRFNEKISSNDVRRVKKKYSIENDYILFLSTLKPSKNIVGLLKAFKLLLDNNQFSISLVIAGKKGWLYKSIFRQIKELGIQSQVIFTDYVDEKDKPGLIKGARVFASPSYTEGFGMHVLEALACGVPVVVSQVDSLPEVVGKAGVVVDHNSPESIAGGIKKVLEMEDSEYNELVANGVKQAGKFSWDKAALETLKVIEAAGR